MFRKLICSMLFVVTLFNCQIASAYSIYQSSDGLVVFLGSELFERVIVSQGSSVDELIFRVETGYDGDFEEYSFRDVTGIIIDFGGASYVHPESLRMENVIIDGHVLVVASTWSTAFLDIDNSLIIGDLFYIGNSGLDFPTIENSTILGGVDFLLKGHTDRITLSSTVFYGDVSVNTGSGEGHVDLVECQFDQDLLIEGKNKRDEVYVDDCSVSGETTIGLFGGVDELTVLDSTFGISTLFNGGGSAFDTGNGGGNVFYGKSTLIYGFELGNFQ